VLNRIIVISMTARLMLTNPVCKPPFAIRMPLAFVSPNVSPNSGPDRVERLLLGQDMRAAPSGGTRRHLTANTTH
jgi:hypothetical protein